MVSKNMRVLIWVGLTVVSFTSIYEVIVKAFPGNIHLAIGMLLAALYSMFNLAINHKVIGYIFVIITIAFGVDFLI